MPRLYVLSGDDLGRTFDVDGPTVIGRGERADVRVRDASVSREHARLEPSEGPGGTAQGWRVVDLGSRNGVFVDGARVRESVLADGAVFRLGELELRLRLVVDTAPPVARPVARPVAPPAPPAPPTPHEPARSRPLAPPSTASDGLELEGDWDEVELAPDPPRAAPAPRPAPRPVPADAPGAASAADRARTDRRRAALAGAARPAAAAPNSGRRVLQYHRVDGGGGLLAGDLAQRPAWQRALVAVLALGALGALGFGAFEVTRRVRAGQARLAPEGDPGSDLGSDLGSDTGSDLGSDTRGEPGRAAARGSGQPAGG